MTSSTRIEASTVAKSWRYSGVAMVLHWLLAVYFFAMAALGWYMMTIEHEPDGPWYINLHKTAGLFIAVLVAFRVVWRLTHRPSALPASVGRTQTLLAHGTQALLYLVTVLLPVTGYLGASFSKSGVTLLGINLAQWATHDHDTQEFFFDVHGLLVWVLVALLSVHVLGALKHLVLDKDGVFQRIGYKPPTGS